MERILISACLLGEPVRYDGKAKGVQHPLLRQWQQEGRLVQVCPETAGGLDVPRAPAERRDDQVITVEGQNVTREFRLGAESALALSRRFNIRLALLKANSPSCGNEQVYDGQFRGKLVPGQGVCAELLRQAGVQVFNEDQLGLLAQALEALEA